MQRVITIITNLCLLAGTAAADYVYLKDGRQIFCQIVRETTANVEVQVERIPVKFPLNQIDHLERTGSLPVQENLKKTDGQLAEELKAETELRGKCLRTPAVDQIVFNAGGKNIPIRLLGVRPWPDDKNERQQVSQILTNRQVVVVLDSQVKDSSGTIQGYVYVNVGPQFGKMVNETILSNGFGDYAPELFSMKYARQLQAAVDEARSRRLGRWEQLLPSGKPAPGAAGPAMGLSPKLYESVTTGTLAGHNDDEANRYEAGNEAGGAPGESAGVNRIQPNQGQEQAPSQNPPEASGEKKRRH